MTEQYEVYDTNDGEILFEGTKQEILEWMWDKFREGLLGIEINLIK